MSDDPELIVVQLRRAKDFAAVDAVLRQVDPARESGSALIPLGGLDYVLPDALRRRLATVFQATTLRGYLAGVRGVAGTATMHASDLAPRLRSSVAPTPASDPYDPVGSEPAWHLQMIKAPQARKLVEDRDLARIRVALMDTGVALHPCFEDHGGPPGRLRLDLGLNTKDPSGENPLPIDPLDFSGQPGHGTRIGSVIAGYRLGVAHGVTLVPYRLTNSVVINFLSGFVGDRCELGRGLRHAIDHVEADVVNISLGDPVFPERHSAEEIDRAYERGVIVVAAAGNITSEVTYPGRHCRAVTAGGVTREGTPWRNGSRGWAVDVCAPSDDIVRAGVRLGAQKRPVYGVERSEGWGTSYAAAHLSGVAALWLAFRHADIDRKYGPTWRRVEAFSTLVRQTAFKPTASWDGKQFGGGIIDAVALLQADLPDIGPEQKSKNFAFDDRV